MCFNFGFSSATLFEKILVAPKSARGGRFRIVCVDADQLGIGRILLLFRIHEFAIGFLVPPGVTEIRIHEEIALMHVAVHALARRNRARELMDDRMAALVFRNGFVGGETETLVSVLAPPAGISRRTIVRVNDVAGRATARAIIARMIVRAQKSEQRIVQSRFLQTEEDRIGAIERAESALGQTIARSAVAARRVSEAELQLFFAAFFENAQNVSRITQVETRQRLDERQNAVHAVYRSA